MSPANFGDDYPPPILHVLLYFTAIALFMRPLFELLPVFAQDLSMQAEDAASLFAALGGGIIGLSFSRLSPTRAIVLSGVGVVAGVIAFVAAPAPWVALAAITILSGCIVGNGVACQVMLQMRMPDGHRGKILSLYTMIFKGMPAFGTLVIGYLAERFHEDRIFSY